MTGSTNERLPQTRIDHASGKILILISEIEVTIRLVMRFHEAGVTNVPASTDCPFKYHLAKAVRNSFLAPQPIAHNGPPFIRPQRAGSSLSISQMDAWRSVLENLIFESD